MTLADRKEARPALSTEVADKMAKHGITHVPVDYFHYGDFRYTNLEDAVAESRRDGLDRQAIERGDDDGMVVHAV